MAHAKLNRFHWHITDSQSFPYMSKAFPQLAKYGAYSSKEIYTADDIKHIADFARIRGIQVSSFWTFTEFYLFIRRTLELVLVVDVFVCVLSGSSKHTKLSL